MRPIGRHEQAILFAILVMGLAFVSVFIGGPAVEPYGWIPLTAAILLIMWFGGLRDTAVWRGLAIWTVGWKSWVPAIAIPGVILTAGYLVAAASGNAQLGLGGTNPLVFAVLTVVIIVAASIEAIGEELGWRGYLLPRLADLGRVRAGLIGGVLWVVWHLPLIYIAAGYHGGAGPLFVLPFGVTIVSMNFVANELRIASGSSWPAVVFHGAHNGIWFQLTSLTVSSTGLLGGIGDESGIVPMTLYALLALWIVVRRPAWSATPA